MFWIHNTRSAQSFFLSPCRTNTSTVYIQVPKFYNSLNEWMDGGRERQTNDWMNEWIFPPSLSRDLFKSGLNGEKWLAMPLILNMLNWAKWKPFKRNVKDYLWGQNSEIVYAQTKISSVYKRLCRDTAQHTILDKAQSTAKHNSSYLPWTTVYLAINPRAVTEPSVTKRTIKVSL